MFPFLRGRGGAAWWWALAGWVLGGPAQVAAQPVSLALTNDTPIAFGTHPAFAESTITVSGSFALTNLTLGITALGQRAAMRIVLVAPDGTAMPIHWTNRSAQGAGTNIDCLVRVANLGTLDTGAASANHDPALPAFDGPNVGPLTEWFPPMLGRDAAGTWRLRVSTENPAANNILARWALFPAGLAGPFLESRAPLVFLPTGSARSGAVLRQFGAAAPADGVHVRVHPVTPASVTSDPAVAGSGAPFVQDGTNLLWTGTVPASDPVTFSWTGVPTNLAANVSFATRLRLEVPSGTPRQDSQATSTRLGGTEFAGDDLLVTARPNWLLPDTGCAATNVLEFEVGESFTIRKLRVGVAARSLGLATCTFRLEGPDGTSIRLFDVLSGGSSAPAMNVLYDDDSATPSSSGFNTVAVDAPYPLGVHPRDDLAAFIGRNTAGTWRLMVCDTREDGRAVRIDHWSLFFDRSLDGAELRIAGEAPPVVEEGFAGLHQVAFTVTNVGSAPAIGARVEIPLDPVALFESTEPEVLGSGTPATFDEVLDRVTWEGDIPAGGTVTIRWDQSIAPDPGAVVLQSAAQIGTVAWSGGKRQATARAETTAFLGLFPDEDLLFTARPNQPIGTTDFATFPIEVPQHFPISRVEVGINLATEVRRRSVHAVLEAPDGQWIRLLVPSNAGESRHYDVRFVPEAGFVQDQGASDDLGIDHYGRRVSATGLTNLVGGDGGGTWRLHLFQSANSGFEPVPVLRFWSLKFVRDVDSDIGARKSVDRQFVKPGELLSFRLLLGSGTPGEPLETALADRIVSPFELVAGSLRTFGHPVEATFDEPTREVRWSGFLTNDPVIVAWQSRVIDASSRFLINTGRFVGELLATRGDLAFVEVTNTTAFLYFDETPRGLPDVGCRDFEYAVTNDVVVTNVAVGLEMEHTFHGHPSLVLEGPDGTTVTVLAGAGTTSGRDFNALISDTGNVLSTTAQDPGPFFFRFPVSSHQPLAAFRDRRALGTWRIRLCDPVASTQTRPSVGVIRKVGLVLHGTAEPLLRAGMTVSPAFGPVGTERLVTCLVTNVGLGPANGITLTNPVPAGTTLVPGSEVASRAPAPTFDGTRIRWDGDLPGGGVLALSFRLMPGAGGSFTNAASVLHASLAVPLTNRVTFQATTDPLAFTSPAPLAIPSGCGAPASSVIHVPQSLFVGSIAVGVNVRSTNRSGINLLLRAPDGREIALFPPCANGGANLDALFDDAGRSSFEVIAHDAGAPFYDNVHLLACAGTNRLSQFQGMNARGDWELRVCGTFPGQVLEHWTLFFTGAPLDLVHELSLPVTQPGETLRVTSLLRNGPVAPANGVTYSNALPAGLVLVPGSLTTSNSPVAAVFADGRVTWTGDLPAGQDVLIAYDATVSGAGTHANLAVVSHPSLASPLVRDPGFTSFAGVEYLARGLVPLLVPGGNCATRVETTIEVPDAFIIRGLKVGLNAVMQPSGLNLELVSPQGIVMNLDTSAALVRTNYDVLLDDEAAVPVDNGNQRMAAPFYDNVGFSDARQLNRVRTLPARGTWRLRVCDDDDALHSRINHWSLFFDVSTEPILTTTNHVARPALMPDGITSFEFSMLNSGGAASDSTFTNAIPAGLAFVPDSLSVSNSAVAPVFDGTRVTWAGAVPSQQAVTVRYLARAATTAGVVITNVAFVHDASLAQPLTSLARCQVFTNAEFVLSTASMETARLCSDTANLLVSTITVTNELDISRLRVGINMLVFGEDANSLGYRFTLTGPSGTSAQLALFASGVGSIDGFDFLCVPASFAQPSASLNPDFPLYTPDFPSPELGRFVGQNALGEWRLSLCVNATNANLHQLRNWALFIDRGVVGRYALDKLLVAAGDVVESRVRVNNTSAAPASGIRVTNVLHPDLEYLPETLEVTGSATAPVFDGSRLAWEGDLPASGELLLRYLLRARATNVVTTNRVIVAHASLPAPQNLTNLCEIQFLEPRTRPFTHATPVAFPPGSTVELPFDVTNAVPVTGLRLGIHYTGAARERIIWTLLSPAGTSSRLTRGIPPDNQFNAVHFNGLFQDAGGASYYDVSHELGPPFYRRDVVPEPADPESPLARHLGIVPAGRWTLRAQADGAFGGGVIDHATLYVSGDPPPVAGPDLLIRDANRAAKIPVARLLANDTAYDGSTPAFVSVASSSQRGAAVQLVEGWVHYEPVPGDHFEDTFTYVVSHRQRSAEGTVTVRVERPESEGRNLHVIVSGGVATLRLRGIPGRSYQFQVTDSLTPPVAWQDLGTPQTADAGGRASTTDVVEGLRFYRAVEP